MLPEIVLIAFYIAVLIYSVIIHEVSHGWAALALGDKTAKYAGRLSLNPASHIDPMGSVVLPVLMLLATGFKFAFGYAKPVPYNPYNLRDQRFGPVWVAVAGPISNFAAALVAAILARVMPLEYLAKADVGERFLTATSGVGDWADRWGALATAMTGSFSAIFFTLCLMIIFWNVLLGVFNLIPLPPLDGSKILFALFDFKTETVAFFEQFGFILLLVIVFSPLGAYLSIPIEHMLRFFFGIVFA